jgi:DNA invertase Pin-like site-specific DNA recombinase
VIFETLLGDGLNPNETFPGECEAMTEIDQRSVQPGGSDAGVGSRIGYARVSTSDQELAVQQDALTKAGCDVIRAEKKSGTSTEGRAELATVLDFIRKGDVLVVTKLDRLARSVADLSLIVAKLEKKGAALQVLNANIDTSTATGKAFLGMLGVFAEFETNLRKERQSEGIAKAKAAGVYKGRPAAIDPTLIRKLRDEGKGATAIADELGIGRASVYRVLNTSEFTGRERTLSRR